MTYRATPITQRDGSSLANSNCRMASIATGLDFETLGAQRSSGAKMRSYTEDQSGGTDSADASQSWQRGYAQELRVRDGHPWADAEADLRAGRLVHLDVWAATVGSSGMCLSGSGAYGHTIAVAPEASGSRWLVADPWCSPARWAWVEGSKLRAGAEEWGRRAGLKAGIPTSGPLTRAQVLLIVAAAKALMHAHNAGNPDPDPGPPPRDTGGAQAILYTTTVAHGAEEDEVRFANANGYGASSAKGLEMVAGDRWTYVDGSPGGSFSGDATVRVFGTVDSEPNQYLALIGTGAPYNDHVTRETLVLIATTRPLIDLEEPAPTPPEDADAIRAERDGEWYAWLLAGAPGEPPE